MPWWGKSSSKEVKRKTNRESIFEIIQRKLKSVSEERSSYKSEGSRKHHSSTISKKGSRSSGPSRRRSPSPSPHVSRCLSFAESHYSQPLPVPGFPLPTVNNVNSGIIVTSKLQRASGDPTSKPSLYFPLPEPGYLTKRGEVTDVEGDIATASVSCDSSIDSGDSSDSHLVSPLASDCENRNRTTINNSFRSVVHSDQSPNTVQRKSRASSKPAHQLCNKKLLSTSPKGVPLHLQIGRPGGFCSAPDSSMSSPSRSPMQAYGQEQVLSSGLWTGKPYQDIASGLCSSPGSGHNSSNNSVGGDPSALKAHNSECSPIPSPRMASPSPSSRIQSSTVSPRHQKAGGAATECPTRRPDVSRQQTHRLPLPPIKVTKSCPFSPTYSASSTPSGPRSPARAENATSPGSHWTKGNLLGRGTFGHVYLGFSRERGEMCAMKEVTLFSDDPKSRECAQQLGQEIALLSQLRHPNIVQYYGSETVDDKLYIYLEYVSGGSIYKLLQEYGQLGEIAIRNYTRQILSGLAYLHAKNTVHRDIKGANILVDPNGQIKLADFGMAKHITGQSLPFSFKGSPYWMAPEVIKNSNGCNLAVDIWSLGCTVLEMATAKPPWSQYEGVAAMFKIGNSKELPTIPDHLSEEGKDFVRLCLQRNPIHRPSASQLLRHPFVRSALLERVILNADPSEAPSTVINAVRSLAIGPAKHNVCLDSEVAGIPPNRSFRAGYGSSNAHKPKIVSCPVSPSGSQRLPSRSVNLSGRISSPTCRSHTASGPSTPQTKQPIFPHEALGVIQKSQNGFQSNGSTTYQSQQHGQFQRNMQARHACHQDIISSENNALTNYNRRAIEGVPIEFGDGCRQDIIPSENYNRRKAIDEVSREFRNGKSCLADRVPQQQRVRDNVRPNASLDQKSSAPVRGRMNGL
ncbi:mitogen-activated protein kinase kinase kinase YODA isoform X1 [Cicer arietinum]|uniref:mitogen-activated protein kinase kinase kinase n=1 Tax=Cicer arietinum TaxID=3827 RepID=A0A1S2YFH3_CICAR|nr:mitogen-activated protein kinase kinase kinase YODA isoform X1 [Cicer arietinum]